MTSPHSTVEYVFTTYQDHMDQEQTIRDDIRETVKELDRNSRLIESTLLGIHQQPLDTSDVCTAARKILTEKVKQLYAELEKKVPLGKYYVYNDHWRQTTRRLAGSASLIYYLETENLVDHETVAEMLGLKLQAEDVTLYLDVEEYLFGLLEMAFQLSRFCVNCVTKGDYHRPGRIGTFMNNLNNGFRALNLKNDYLRKSYDRLKYDLKKVEEVIYDVSIRGLVKPENMINASNPVEEENPSVEATTPATTAPSAT